MSLIVKNVQKSFIDKLVVDDLSFEINKPSVFGLLGTNGAGKTTTIRMILGILKKDNGEISWDNKNVTRDNVNFGYLPEERGIYPKIKIYDQLMYFAKLKGMKKEDAEKALDFWMEKLKVTEYKYMTAEKLSKGNQQKIQFITAILHNPDLIILDEPFSGLDPVNTELLKNVIIDLVKQGKYIIMSHQMTSIEEFCTEVLILDKGKTVLKGNLKEIKETYPANRIEIITFEDISTHISSLNLKTIFSKNNEYLVEIKNEEQGFELFNLLSKNNVKVIKFEIKKPSLHDIFIERVGE